VYSAAETSQCRVVWGRAIDCEDFHDFITKSNSDFVAPIWYGTNPTETLTASSTLLIMNGRRYKFSEAIASWMTGTTRIALTESYSGQHFLEICQNCVRRIEHDGNSETTLQVANDATFDLEKGDFLLVGSNTDMRNGMYVTEDYVGAGDGGAPVRIITGHHLTGKGTASITEAANQLLPLYKATSMNGYKPILVTESTSQVTYQYVSQCANRGTCDGGSGLCTCFKGYTGHNCDTQNMLAM
jgi:hypothetical protein